MTNGSVSLGAGADTLTLANGTNSAVVSNVDTIVGGTGNDTVTLDTAANNASISLGAGNDTLHLGNFANTATVGNVDTISAGTGIDAVTLSTALTNGMSVDLGSSGANTLTLSNANSTGTVSDVATLQGGSGTDSITLGTAMVNGSVDLGAGADTLQLANATNSVSVGDVATVLGGTADDTIVLLGSNASYVDGGGGMDFITGNTGADEFVLDQDGPGNASTVENFDDSKGDTIGLDTTSTYNLGGTALIDGTTITSVADNPTLLSTVLNNSGNGGVRLRDR